MTGAGELDRRITIESTTETRGSGGGIIDTWAIFDIRWAKREYKGGFEGEEADKRVSTNVILYTVRYDPDKIVTPKMRVSDDGDIWQIRFIEKIGRNNLLILHCENNE